MPNFIFRIYALILLSTVTEIQLTKEFSYVTWMGQTKGTFKALNHLGKSYVKKLIFQLKHLGKSYLKQLIFQLLNDQTTQLKAQSNVPPI